MSRHASAEELAMLDLDGLKPRKAAKVRAHMSGCSRCTELSSEMSAVPATLASVSYPAMPEQLSARLDTALATESAHRLATAPASEAGRRDLPARSRRAPRRAGRQLPGLSVLATRLVAAGTAVIIAGVGGFEIASHVGGNAPGTAASSSGSVAAPSAQAQQMTPGADVRYGQPASMKSVQTVDSHTNFTAASFGAEAEAAVQGAKLRGTLGAQANTGAAPTTRANSSSSTNGNSANGNSAPAETQLTSCLDGVVGNQTVLLVDQAMYEGKPATIIVTAQTASRGSEVWAVGPACSASHPDVLAHVTLART
jgi:hypothetical protein